ncbi:lantibiotic dehydratase [Brevibacterium sp.]|uniref:lantibiotic dehydratase n=1 Tax=Brevibacterium sp. TaxID=1701 RepID=UPI0026499674|nr:lantibiotic dehydratase [Brevibacterium sp.]MDN6603845.1 lantibiotic dehydratase family protein [Brevibacterium sp.]
MTVASIDSYRQLRFGGLDVNAARSLPGEEATAWYEEFAHAQRALTASKDTVSGVLHTVIGSLGPHDPDRGSLLKIRRDLFNASYDAALAGIDSLESHGRDVRSRLGDHIGHLEMVVDGGRATREKFESWLTGERERLVSHIRDDEFLSGVAISAPSLIPSIHRFDQHVAADTVDKKDRKTERSILSYVLRAATKTSPFSSLGSVSLTRSCACDARADGVQAQYASRWSIYPIARVLNALAAEPTSLAALEVSISPYTRPTEGGTEVQRTRWSFKDIDSRDDYAACVESVVTIGQRSLTSAVEELLVTGTTFGELTQRLATSGDLSQGRSRQLLGNLLRVGFLEVPALTFHPHGFEDARRSIARIGSDGVLADTLTKYCDRAEAFAGLGSAEERVNELKSLQNLVNRAYEEAGVDAQLPRSLVYEDVLVPPEQVDASSMSIDGIPMDLLTMLIDLLDDANLKHALMVGYFMHRWGEESTCSDVASFLTKFQTELLDSFEGYELTRIKDEELSNDPWLMWGEAWRWVAGRRRLAEILTAQSRTVKIGQGPLLFDEEVDLSHDFRELAEDLPLSSPPFRHFNLLLQTTGGEDVVLNDSFGGIGFPVSRFSHVVDDPRRYTADVEQTATQAGVVLAEVAGGALFTNLNAHGPLVEAEIVLPGDPPGSRSRRPIELGELNVRYEPEQKRLVLVDGQGDFVHPIYPGYLVPAATPRQHQVLSLFGPTGNLSRKPADTIEMRPEPGTVLASPRLRLGRVVIDRARAMLLAIDFPRANPLTAGGYQQWVEFWVVAGLPQRAFVRILDDSERRNKPAFHDSSMVLCFSILYNHTRDAGASTYVEVIEALPAPGEATADVGGSERASESMVGISLTKGVS